MKTLLRLTGFCFLFLVVLTFEINNKTVFDYIYRPIAPAIKYTQKTVKNFFSDSFSTTKKYSKSLFENSVPKMKDSIKSKQSAPLKEVREPQERITDQEKKELESLIKGHR